MKNFMIFLMLILLASTQQAKVLTTFEEVTKPIELRIHGVNAYISDRNSVLIINISTGEIVKKLGRRGEGPEEFKTPPRIHFLKDKIILNDVHKILTYSYNYILINEFRLGSIINRINPLEEKFVFSTTKIINNQEYYVFTLHDKKCKKNKSLIKAEFNPRSKFFLTPMPRCRTWKDKIYIALPKKGFIMEVFNESGEKLFSITKDFAKIRSTEQHRSLALFELRNRVGRKAFERAKQIGAFDRPMPEFLAPIKNFWVLDDKIYVKTHDITNSKEKYIIMDVLGKTLKTVFLPYTIKELVTFSQGKIFFLKESESEEKWQLHAVTY